MIGIVIPAYNAAKTLAGVLARLPGPSNGGDPWIWIIDDGSTDDTRAVAEALSREASHVECIWHVHNRGYGAAVKSGLKRAIERGVQVVVCLHADGQYAPEELLRLVNEREIQDVDLLQGSRIASGGALAGGMPLYKYFANRALTALENAVFRMKLTDYHSGYLLYGPRALAAIDFARLSDSFDFDLEVIASAQAAGLRVGEAPIPTHYGEEVSYLNPLTYGLRCLRVVWRYARGHYG